MPVLAKAQEPQKFTTCLVAAIGTLCVLFIFFGELTSLTFGSNLTEPFITQMLPSANWGVALIKVGYTVNLICSYPITVKPTNEIIESYLFRKGVPSPRIVRSVSNDSEVGP